MCDSTKKVEPKVADINFNFKNLFNFVYKQNGVSCSVSCSFGQLTAPVWLPALFGFALLCSEGRSKANQQGSLGLVGFASSFGLVHFVQPLLLLCEATLRRAYTSKGCWLPAIRRQEGCKLPLLSGGEQLTKRHFVQPKEEAQGQLQPH
jgi:hypothetical protein